VAIDQHLETIETDRGFGTDANALGRRTARHPVGDGIFAARKRFAAAVPDGVEHEKIADGRRHAQSARHRLSVLEACGEPLAAFERSHDWRTTVTLTRI